MRRGWPACPPLALANESANQHAPCNGYSRQVNMYASERLDSSNKMDCQIAYIGSAFSHSVAELAFNSIASRLPSWRRAQSVKRTWRSNVNLGVFGMKCGQTYQSF